LYDGSSYSSTTEAAMIEGGDHTWACEAWLDSTPTGVLMGLMGDTVPGTSGMQLLYVESTKVLNYGGANGTANSLYSMTGLLDQWVTIVGVHDRAGANVATVWVNATEGTNDPLTGASAASTTFRLGTGPDNTTRELYGRLRNVEIYSGVATNPGDWVPGNTSSMSGVTLKYQSTSGGEESDPSITWATTGTPVKTAC